MRKFYLSALFASVFTAMTFAQTPGQDKSVLLSATLQNNPPQITISWQAISGAAAFDVYRKAKTDVSWEAAVATGLPGTSTNWTDNSVQTGTGYEYRVVATGTTAYGYIYSAIELPEAFYRGKILLVYDTVSTAGLTAEIHRWISDVEGDGWEVIEIPVHQNDAVTDVKSRILAEYNYDKENVRSVFVFGRVPVPYSGNIAPDGHSDHVGAWPADGYYAELTGDWTDIIINNTGASQERNRNVPGDGKFDQSAFPTDLELEAGRVDMRNLPAFSQSETQLLKNYLDKNHAYRNKLFKTENRALIDDNFTSYGEGFSASGWRNFAVLCGASNIVTTDYFNTMKTGSYQWSYGCGAGSYTGCAGVGSTTNFVNDSLQSIFTMLFGSYFGDWDSPSNNILRATLASGSTLTNCWSGRPFWHFHHMGLGDHIGYSAMRSMNNTSATYDANNSTRGIHMALMGDPTLRAHIIAPAQNLVANYLDGKALLSWDASPDSVAGYHIFRKTGATSQYEKINTQMITATVFTDSCLIEPGIYTYMVRAVRLETTNSGSFYNMSTGITGSLHNPDFNLLIASFSFVQNGSQVSITNTSQNATGFQWDFGDGNGSTQQEPDHNYAHDGNYTITLIASSACGSDTITAQVHVNTAGAAGSISYATAIIYPNPTDGILYIDINNMENTAYTITVFDVMGKTVHRSQTLETKTRLNLSEFGNGAYYLLIGNNEHFLKRKIIIQKP